MTTKSFEELFPELKDRKMWFRATSLEFPDDGRRKCELVSNSETLCNHIKEEIRSYRNDFVLIEDMEKHCLSKQRVKEAIGASYREMFPIIGITITKEQKVAMHMMGQKIIEKLGLNKEEVKTW